MFMFNECQGDSTQLEILRYDGAQCLHPEWGFQWGLTLQEATKGTRGCRHHSSISIFDPIPTHRSGHEHLLKSTGCKIENSVVPKYGLHF